MSYLCPECGKTNQSDEPTFYCPDCKKDHNTPEAKRAFLKEVNAYNPCGIHENCPCVSNWKLCSAHTHADKSLDTSW